MDLEELKLCQLEHQHLLEPTDYRTAVRDLCGIQAQFLSNAFHAISIRSDHFDPCNTGALLKSWTIRGTMHLFDREDLPLFLHEGRTHFLRLCDTLLEDEFVTRERKAFFADLIVQSIASGMDTREELKAVCIEHGMTDAEGDSIFNAWGGTIRALCENGTICHKVQQKKAFCLCPPFTPLDADTARLELARRYFTHYGPATVKDAAYFFNTTQAQVKQWLRQLPVTALSCHGTTYFEIQTQAPTAQTLPDCLFLAGFDPLMLGYQKTESLYLPQAHLRNIFTMAGIVMPSVLLHGRVVGKWKRKGSQLLVTLFEHLSLEEKNCMENKAHLLWGDTKHIEFNTI